ncbi:hypothetical protein CYMTET_11155 [Cymbomonas tetramitiformis]|uniref:Uncharacterized protein n=1 Tax=Cymbomonas tetramitiformis TaxID=36881 RepID=A0AAE0GN34_9CHLO|nr:hypothetical protein CYMTET_12054 [Cymbomonas tetramitiformis]KAK3281037.1 hypothetical protein CYMTET_11155 [Cymbomonas tetramitiformis]
MPNCQSFAPDRIPLAAKPAYERPPLKLWPAPPDPSPPVRALALQEPQDPTPDSTEADVSIMGFRCNGNLSAEADLLATDSAEAAVGASPSAAAFNAMELDIEDNDWPEFRTVHWVPSCKH